MLDHEAFMQLAILEAEHARGTTGDNPWVGCVLVDPLGGVVAQGHTQGPGEDHAEIAAFRVARARGVPSESLTLYSTLEPCSFHARTPACSRVIVEERVSRVIIGMRDPHPRVDGEGARILRDAGIEVIEGVCEREVRRQLGSWVLIHHPHEPLRRARALSSTHEAGAIALALAEIYAVDLLRAEGIVRLLSEPNLRRPSRS